MREVVLDTETTGLSPAEGHRIVEIGVVELVNHLPTGRSLHHYVNPERSMPEEARAVHGLDDGFLASQPVFGILADEVLEFLADSPLVIHNAEFDIRFLNHELSLLGRPPLPPERAVDTLAMARRRFPGAPASLDALCRRFCIDNSAREKHGALLDSEILAAVYLELIGGRQPGFGLDAAAGEDAARQGVQAGPARRRRATPLPPRLTEAERIAHHAFIAELGEDSLWAAIERGDSAS